MLGAGWGPLGRKERRSCGYASSNEKANAIYHIRNEAKGGEAYDAPWKGPKDVHGGNKQANNFNRSRTFRPIKASWSHGINHV